MAMDVPKMLYIILSVSYIKMNSKTA